MADTDELYYLQPGFDLSSLTVPRMRSILVAHNVNYASSAKKSELLEILQTELLPQARKLLRDRDRVRRTSRGIQDMPSSQDGTLDEDESDDRERMPPPRAPRTPRSRKSRTNLQDEDDGVEPTPRTTQRSKTPTARRTTKTPRASDVEIEPVAAPTTSKRTRKSMSGPVAVTQTPSVRLQDAKDTRRSLEAGESPFTDDNPFQQKSSPSSDSKQASSSSRTRKSIGSSSTRKSTSRRRSTRSPVEIKSEGIEFPVSHLSTGADGVETTEEFAEDAREELGRDLAADRQLAKSRRKDVVRHKKKPQSTAAKTAPWAILATALSAMAAWYRQEKIAVGYCQVGQPNWSLVEVDTIPTWVHEAFQPECEPCPQHAICYPNMQVECERDFVLVTHPFSIGGLVPIPPTCEPDSEKEKRIKAVADRSVEELRNRRAAHECGGDLTSLSSTTEIQSSTTIVSPAKLEVSEQDLKETISKQRRRNMSPEEFEDLWMSALDNIKGRDEVEVTQDKSGRVLLKSNSFANLPFTCSIRRSAIRTLAANRVAIISLILTLLGGVYSRQRYIAYGTVKKQTPNLVAIALDRLATQAVLKEDGRVDEAFISVAQLRDDVLRNVIDRAERERAWERVKKIVETNSNVRAATREGGKTGEWSRVWEWIGPINFVPGLEGRRSGGFIEESPGLNSSGQNTPAGREVREIGEVRKWDEGRAIY